MLMKKVREYILLCVLMLVFGYVTINSHKLPATENENMGSNEDLEVIENLDFLDSLDLFEEDLALLENYDGIDEPEGIDR